MDKSQCQVQGPNGKERNPNDSLTIIFSQLYYVRQQGAEKVNSIHTSRLLFKGYTQTDQKGGKVEALALAIPIEPYIAWLCVCS